MNFLNYISEEEDGKLDHLYEKLYRAEKVEKILYQKYYNGDICQDTFETRYCIVRQYINNITEEIETLKDDLELGLEEPGEEQEEIRQIEEEE